MGGEEVRRGAKRCEGEGGRVELPAGGGRWPQPEAVAQVACAVSRNSRVVNLCCKQRIV